MHTWKPVLMRNKQIKLGCVCTHKVAMDNKDTKDTTFFKQLSFVVAMATLQNFNIA